METVYLIVTVIGFIILGLYQRYYIKALEGQIKTQKDLLDSQNKTIENLKMHVEIFQPDKIHEFVKMRETTFEDKKAKEIDKIKSQMEEKSKKSSNALKLFLNEYVIHKLYQSKYDTNRIYIGTSFFEMSSMYKQNNKWIYEGKIEGTPQRLKSLVERSDGNLWISDTSGELFLVNLSKDSIRS